MAKAGPFSDWKNYDNKICSHIISKLVILFTSLSNPDNTFFRNLKKAIMKFIWHSKPVKIKHSILINDIKSGGLKLCVCAMLAQLVRSLTANQKVPGLSPGLVEG